MSPSITIANILGIPDGQRPILLAVTEHSAQRERPRLVTASVAGSGLGLGIGVCLEGNKGTGHLRVCPCPCMSACVCVRQQLVERNSQRKKPSFLQPVDPWRHHPSVWNASFPQENIQQISFDLVAYRMVGRGRGLSPSSHDGAPESRLPSVWIGKSPKAAWLRFWKKKKKKGRTNLRQIEGDWGVNRFQHMRCKLIGESFRDFFPILRGPSSVLWRERRSGAETVYCFSWSSIQTWKVIGLVANLFKDKVLHSSLKFHQKNSWDLIMVIKNISVAFFFYIWKKQTEKICQPPTL